MPVVTIDLPKVTVEVVTLNGVPMNRVTITTSGDLKEIRWDLLPVSLAVQQLSGAGGTAGVPGSSDATALLQSAGNTLLTAIRDAQATEATLAARLSEATYAARQPTIGQKTAATSVPVVIASDQLAITTRSLTVATALQALVVTAGAYLALDVFGGLITFAGVFPDVGTGPRGGRTLTLTEITVETGGAFALGVIACSRTPATAFVDNAVFTFEGARQLAMRPMSAAVQTDANSWTAYLAAPLTITQDVADTTDNLCLYLISLTAQSHVGVAAWVRLGGYID